MTQWEDTVVANKLHSVLALMAGETPTEDPVPAKTGVKIPGQSGSSGGGGGGGSEIGSRDQDEFYVALLNKLGMPVNDQNLRFMRAWNQGEGMDAGHHNPFATTQGGFGGSDLNSVGVKSYADMESGVDATATTLTNGQYGGILAGLQASDPYAAARGVADSPWGTGGLVLQILGG